MKHILIDYENSQPKDFAGIDTTGCHIWLFLGVHQQKSLPLELVEKLLRFESQNVHIVKMQNSGKNALDFYLAFYLGKISEIDPEATVCIIARDSGYDVLVEHLNMRHDGIDIVRIPNCEKLGLIHELQKPTQDISPALEDNLAKTLTNDTDNQKSDVIKAIKSDINNSNLPPIDTNKSNLADSQQSVKVTIYQQAVASLKNRPSNSRPAKKQTLKNHLRNHLKNEKPYVIDNIIKQMIANKIVVVNSNNKLTYPALNSISC